MIKIIAMIYVLLCTIFSAVLNNHIIAIMGLGGIVYIIILELLLYITSNTQKVKDLNKEIEKILEDNKKINKRLDESERNITSLLIRGGIK